jgi:hypothetical protein
MNIIKWLLIFVLFITIIQGTTLAVAQSSPNAVTSLEEDGGDPTPPPPPPPPPN